MGICLVTGVRVRWGQVLEKPHIRVETNAPAVHEVHLEVSWQA